MSEMYIKVRVPNYTPQTMSDDQYYQMVVLARESQSYLPFKNVALFDLIRISYYHCISLRNSKVKDMDDHEQFYSDVNTFLRKYYPDGFRKNNRCLSPEQLKIVKGYRSPRFNGGLSEYDPIELIAYIKTMRACRDFLFSKQEQADYSVFAEKLVTVAIMMKSL